MSSLKTIAMVNAIMIHKFLLAIHHIVVGAKHTKRNISFFLSEIIKLMTLGLTEKEAEAQIVNGFLK